MSSRLPIAPLAAPSLSGCKKKAAVDSGPVDVAPRLGSVTVQDLTAPEALPAAARIDAKALTEELRGRLASAGIFAPGSPDAGGAPVARVRAELALEEVQAEGKAAGRAMVRFRVDTRPAEQSAPHWNEDVQAGAETTYPLTPPPDHKAIFAKLASRSIADLASAY